MKTQLTIYPAMVAMLFIACDERNDATNMERIDNHNKVSGTIHESDTNIVKRDGTIIARTIDQMDSVLLPSLIINKIKEDELLSKERINEIRKFTEDDLIYYEIKFTTANSETNTVIFDEKGNVKTKD